MASEPKSRPLELVSAVGLPNGNPMLESELLESMRCLLNESSIEQSVELEPEENDDLGLIGGIWSAWGRRDAALKLKFLLNISLGWRFLRTFATHPVAFAAVLILNIGAGSVGGPEAVLGLMSCL